MYFVWARSKVKVFFYFQHHAVFAQIPENIEHLGKYIALLAKTNLLLA